MEVMASFLKGKRDSFRCLEEKCFSIFVDNIPPSSSKVWVKQIFIDNIPPSSSKVWLK